MKDRWKRGAAFFLGLILLITASSCRGRNPGEETKSPDTKKIQIGFSIDSLVNERWIRDRDVFVSAAGDLGAEVNVQNSNGSNAEQIRQIEYFIEKKMDVIVVIAGDRKGLSNVLRRAKDAGIKVVCYDRLVSDANCDLYISFDNEMVGYLMGESLVKNLPNGGDIFMIQGPLSDGNVDQIRKGFDKAIAGSALKVVYEAHCKDWVPEYAYKYVKEALKTHPHVKAIMCGNDDLATQAFRALAEERLAGSVLLTGQDGDILACQRIVEGTQLMTAFKAMEEEARLAAEYSIRLAKGEKLTDIKERISDGMYQVPYKELQPIAVTKENMDEVIIRRGFHTKEDVYLNVIKP